MFVSNPSFHFFSETNALKTYGSVVPDSGRYSPPEVAKSGWEVIKRHPVSAVDSYGFGLLIFEVFNGCVIGNEQIGQTQTIPPTMHQSYKRLLTATPKARLSVSHFRDQGRRSGGFFETPLIKLSEGIESFGLKSEGEREIFLRYEIIQRMQNYANKLRVNFMKSQMITLENFLM